MLGPLQAKCFVRASGGMTGGLELSRRPTRQEGSILVLWDQALEQMMCHPEGMDRKSIDKNFPDGRSHGHI